MLACAANALSAPVIPGAEVTAFDVGLVKNYNATASQYLYYGHPTVVVENASFCNITVTYTHPGANDSVHVETWLPVDNYNGRLQSIGGGGWVAGRYPPTYPAMAGAIGQGYATSTTDAGLLVQADYGPDIWALTKDGRPNMQLLTNFASLSLNEQAIVAKALIEAFYGQPPEYSYYNGCSQGGRQGMALAQRYPDAYDGIHAGAPAIFWNNLMSYLFWPQLYMSLIGAYPYLCEFKALAEEAVKACDHLDGVEDGIIADDGACTFDPSSVVGRVFLCADTGKAKLISSEAAQVANATWSGPRTTEGKLMWYGSNIGSPLSGSAITDLTNDIGPARTRCFQNGSCIGEPLGLGETWIKYFVEADPTWTYKNMTHESFQNYFHKANMLYDSVIGTQDSNLSAFHRRGGKMLTYHGMSDQIIPVKGTEHYHNLVREQVPEVNDFYRLFKVPGLLHCAGGPGGQPTNTFDALRAWVENGSVPETILHAYTTAAGRKQERLLCPFPMKAQLKACAHSGKKKTFTAKDYECVPGDEEDHYGVMRQHADFSWTAVAPKSRR
ncbi:hypothetical protein NHJ13051_009527 [Beauveria bassiana]